MKCATGPRVCLHAAQSISPEFAPAPPPLAPAVSLANTTPLFMFYPVAQQKSRPVTTELHKTLLVESAGLVYIQAHHVL